MIREKEPERYNAALERMVEWTRKKAEENPRATHQENKASEKKEERKEVRFQEGGSSGSGEKHQEEESGNKRRREESKGSNEPITQSETHPDEVMKEPNDNKRVRDLDEFEKIARRKMEEKKEKREREEAEREEKMKVMRTEGESQGIITKTMEVDWMSDEQFEEKKDELRESRIPFVIIRGKEHKREDRSVRYRVWRENITSGKRQM